MRIAFLGYFVPEDDLADASGVSMADNKMQYDYITAMEILMESDSADHSLTVFSTEKPSSVKSKFFSVSKSRGEYISYADIRGIRTPSKVISAACSIVKWVKDTKKQGEASVLFYYNTFFLNVAAAAIARLFCKFYLIPIAITLPYLAEGEDRLLPQKAERMCAGMLKKSNGIVAITGDLAGYLCPGKPNLIINGGVSVNQLEPDNQLDSHNFPPREPGQKKRIVYTGAIYSRYNLDKVIAAAELLDENHYQVIIYGHGPDTDKIEEMCKTSKVARYGGFVTGDELREVQGDADVLLALLSTDDQLVRYTFPSKLFEYMAVGNPIVTSGLPCLSDELKRYVKVVPEITPEAIRDDIIAACRFTNKERELYRAACQKYLLQNMTWERHGERLREFLKLIIMENGKWKMENRKSGAGSAFSYNNPNNLRGDVEPSSTAATAIKRKKSSSQLVWNAARAITPWFGPSFILAILATITVTLPMPLFLLRNGSFVFYASELAVGAGFIAAIVMLIRKKYKVSPFLKKTLVALVLFLICYCGVTAARIFLGYTWSQSVLTLRTTVLPLFVLLMMDMRIEKGRRCMLGLVAYNFVICAAQMGYVIFSEVRMSPFMGNLMVFTCAAVLLIPANFFCFDLVIRKRCPKIFSWIALFNLFCVIFIPFMGGARSTVAASMMGIVISVFIFRKRKTLCKSVFAVILVSFTVIFSFWALNFGGKSVDGLYRVLPTPAQAAKMIKIKGSDKLPGGDNYVRKSDKSSGKGSAASDTRRINQTQQERDTSDASRSDLWKASIDSIKRSPIIGEGTIYFPISTSYGVDAQAAHNFILEHINAFGGVGFILWSAIFLVPLWQIITSGGPKKYRPKKRRTPKLCLMCAVLMMAVQSSFQPTMMIVPTVTLLWLVIASWKAVVINNK